MVAVDQETKAFIEKQRNLKSNYEASTSNTATENENEMEIEVQGKAEVQ